MVKLKMLPKINIAGLLMKEEPIAGLEISDDYLRLAYLEPSKDKTGYNVKFLIEEKLEDNVSLADSLKKLAAKSGFGARYVIVSISSDKIYSKILYFPRTIEDKKIEESIRLAVNFQLPVSPEESYIDYYELTAQDELRREFFLAAVTKTVIDEYILALNSAGFNPVAIEPHYQSFLRAADLPSDQTILVKADEKESIGIFIVKAGVLKFNRVIPKKFLTQEKTEEELRKISDFYETENDTPVDRKIILSEIKTTVGLENKWLTAAGAAMRGAMNRSEDIFLSLMPVSTEEAYDYQKAVVFSGFLSNIIVGLSAFFAAAFFGVWLLMLAIQQNLSSKIEIFSLTPPSKESVEIENKVRDFNELTKIGAAITKTFPRHSVVFDALKPLVPAGVSITQSSFSSDAKISATGVARNRTELNSFKKKLEESGVFAEINLPLTNLEMRENIPFSISFRLKNQSALYW